MIFKRTHFRLFNFQKRTFFKVSLKSIKSLSINKASPVEYITINILKNSIISTQKNLLIFSLNVWLRESFPTHWKEQMLLRFFLKNGTIMERQTIAQWVCCQPFQKCLKNYYLNKLMIICNVIFKASYRFSQKSQHSKCSTGYYWTMEGYFEQKTQSRCSFYRFVKRLWYLRSLSIIGKIKCLWFW